MTVTSLVAAVAKLLTVMNQLFQSLLGLNWPKLLHWLIRKAL